MATLYETDFYGWTQEQAAKLRALLTERANSGEIYAIMEPNGAGKSTLTGREPR